ncbi:hypothetical protein C7974DRAFT_434757 [Boeremia exigua]|uniref:uncharacterized protein n=1 Tax=Boeremia exigua TaxID=749465 RepID=UPI001E8DED53|nr:uncharacterized protein C7974DRAFT_434757 [Boeremia exigua]KAH6625757.1 hypothetical protein C7974DRAFT_434757 [Boeremia exigua]
MPQQAARAFSQKDLPPSVEAAYYRKCIELRRRINDIEENNDGTRQRIQRLNRGIQKMRLERAFLLDRLQRHQEYSMDDSDRSSSPPPTPTDKPLRSKRSHRKGTPPAASADAAPDSGARAHSGAPHAASPGEHGSHLAISHPHAINPMSSAQSTPDPSRHTNPFFSSIGASASPHASHSTVNGNQNALPPLHSLPGMQPQGQQTPTPRAYFDPAYGAERPTPVPAESEGGRQRAYSGAQPPQHAEAPHNGDTEMRDAAFSTANNNQ